jgi:hypothetical protein
MKRLKMKRLNTNNIANKSEKLENNKKEEKILEE